jgi:hypothetical protein
MTGFLSYFTAPNIRYKIKNPLFLAYRFSNFVTLYYNILKCSDVNVIYNVMIGCSKEDYGLLLPDSQS